MTVQYIDEYSSSRVDQAVIAGLGAPPKQYVKGGEYAYGTILFADNPTATDTITLNGVVIEFSAAASDFGTAGTVADPYILNIKASLTLTIDEIVTQCNGSANASLSVATYANLSGTTLTIDYDTIGTTGNSYTLASSADTASGATLTGGQATEALDINRETINIAISDTRNQYFSLEDGREGQRKVIAMTAKGTGNAVVTPANFSSGTTITFDTDGDIWFGIFINGNWKTVASDATVA